MANPMFLQNSRLGRALFEIRGDALDVTGRDWGRKVQRAVPLRTIDPSYECLSRRVYVLFVAPLVGCVICAAAISVILHQEGLPQEMVIWPGMFLPGLLWAAIRGTPPVVFYRFRNHWQRPVLHIIRERWQRRDCDAFVAELAVRIAAVRSEVPSDELARRIARLEADAASAPTRLGEIGQDRWLVSVVVGLASNLFVAFPALAPLLGDWAFPVIFLLCCTSVVFGLLSFLAKEPRRLVALGGIAAGLLPTFYCQFLGP